MTGDGVTFDPGHELTQLDDDVFEARFPYSFGGLTLAAATLLAGRSCPDKRFRSSHLWFLRGTPVDELFRIEIDRIRDGRLLSHRRVRFVHNDKLLCELTASYTAPGQGASIPAVSPEPGIPQPEDLPSAEETAKTEGWDWWEEQDYEWRYIGRPFASGQMKTSKWHAWCRPTKPFVDEDAVHASAFAYMSDNHSDWAAGLMIEKFEHDNFISLDNSIWAHRPLVWDDWLLCSSQCDIGFDGAMFTRRQVFNREGGLVASIAQEAIHIDPA
jgi:acyl-CoA thioesterase-2